MAQQDDHSYYVPAVCSCKGSLRQALPSAALSSLFPQAGATSPLQLLTQAFLLQRPALRSAAGPLESLNQGLFAKRDRKKYLNASNITHSSAESSLLITIHPPPPCCTRSLAC